MRKFSVGKYGDDPENQHFAYHSRLNQAFRQSGYFLSLPVVTSCGGTQPGQNRDKWRLGHRRLSDVIPVVFPRGRRPRRSGKKSEANAETRKELERELDQMVAEFHARLPRANALFIGVIYARFSTEFQHSIQDQVRALLEYALSQGIFVPRENIFFDLAVRGLQDRRQGLNQLRELLAKKAAQIVLVFTTNRLYRKSYKSMRFVEEEVVERGLRCIFVKSGIDTANDRLWRPLLQVHAMLDEMGTAMYADNIQAAHIGLFHKCWVVTTIPYGYEGKVVDGPLTKRHRPRREIVINAVTSEWVRRIFVWFVEDLLSLNEIIARLNREGAPLPDKATAGYWDWRMVRGILSDARYRGYWTYGRGKNVWLHTKDYAKREMRDQPLANETFEHLRLIDDEMWNSAQQRLGSFWHSRGGRNRKDAFQARRPRVLNGLLICRAHDRPMPACGTNGQFVGCSHCQALGPAERPLHTYLSRTIAIRMICQRLVEALREDHALVEQVIAACRMHVESVQKPDPKVLTDCLDRIQRLDRRIKFILANSGESDADRAESAASLRTLRMERSALVTQSDTIRIAAKKPTRVPTEAEVRALFEQLADILAEAAESGEPEDAAATRAVIEMLTGGRIYVEQAGERKRFQGWLRGHFHLRVVAAATAKLSGLSNPEAVDEPEVVVDFKEETANILRAKAVKELYDQGLLLTEIGLKLGINRHTVTAALRVWHDRHQLPMPRDGRCRRATVAKKQRSPYPFQKIADRAKQLFDSGMMYKDIATTIGCDRTTIRIAIRHWYRSRDLPIPGRRPRCELRKSTKPRPGRIEPGVE